MANVVKSGAYAGKFIYVRYNIACIDIGKRQYVDLAKWSVADYEVISGNTRKSMSKSQKLETCFRWVMKRYYRTWRRFSQGGKAWYAVNANDHFERGCGDCIADASAFAYLAKALGYKNVYVCTDGHRNDENSHGWAEINGRVYDPLFAEAKSYSRNYGVRYGVYPLSPVMRVKIA